MHHAWHDGHISKAGSSLAHMFVAAQLTGRVQSSQQPSSSMIAVGAWLTTQCLPAHESTINKQNAS
jgi:hypothetical protein